MKNGIRAAAVAAIFIAAALLSACSPRQEADYPAAPVGFTSVKLDDVFWAPRLEVNRRVTVPHNIKMAEDSGRIRNFELAAAALAGAKDGRFASSYPFDDSDVYKVIEAACYTLSSVYDPALAGKIDRIIAAIAAAQEPDGYLYTMRTIGGPPPVDWMGGERWSNLYMSHELYNLGHLYEAAAAHYEATGKRTLLDVAVKSARLLMKEFGPGRRQDPPGHQEIEIGLAKLYRVTGDAAYLDLAKFFIDVRGKSGAGRKLYGEYSQDHLPLAEQTEAVGHAVRAGYFYAGAADVAALTGDRGTIAALDRIWADVVGSKIYITGGIGATGEWEGYGPRYYLPNPSSYAETCAAIATFLWNSRMFRLEEDGKYVDVMERILYNGILSGISLSGDRFFYPNPLASFGQHERTPWFGCACCPPNVARLIASVPGYLYAVGRDRVYLNLYAQGTADLKVGRTGLKIRETTEYPWSGRVAIAIEPERPVDFSLMVRIPGWAVGRPIPSDLYVHEGPAPASPVLEVNGRTVPAVPDRGYVRIERKWQAGDKVVLTLPMEPRRVKANDAVEADRGRVAVERGPLVYCAEWPDNGGTVSDLVLDDTAVLTAEPRPDLLGGIVVIRTEAASVGEKDGKLFEGKKPAVLIPYYSWANRGKGEMAVWLPRTPDKAIPAGEPGLSARAVVTASGKARNIDRVNDRYRQESSADAVSCLNWRPVKGSLEWVEYAFDGPVRVSESSVYWFDEGKTGECRVPASWRLFYRRGVEWVPVDTADGYDTAADAYNTVRFAPVRTKGLRLEVRLQDGMSAGIQDWKVR